MKKKLAIILAAVMATALCACGGGGGGSEEKSEAASGSAGDLGTELVLYTPMTDSDIEALLTCFNEKYPDINVDVVSGSIGELTAKIQAEADNPQADLVWGGVQDSDGEQYADLFEPWVTAYAAENMDPYQSVNSCYSINHLSPVCFCVNLELEKELGLNITSYEDLLDPALKGKVIISDPNSSSAAWNNLCNIMAVYGYDTDEAWAYIEKLMANLVVVEKSSACFNSINDGEYVVGLTYEDGAVKLLQDGSDKIALRYPAEGTSSSAFGCAVVKNAPHMEAAKAMVDFLGSAEGESTMAAYMEGTVRFTNKNYTMPEKAWLADTSTITWVIRPVAELTEGKAGIIEHWNQLWGTVHGN